MSKGFACFISFVAGAGVGVAGTYFYMRRRTDDKIDEAIQDFKKEYKGIRRVYAGNSNDISKEDAEKTDSRKSLTEVHSSIQDGPVEIDKVAYHKVSKEYDKEGFLEDLLEEDSESDLDGKTAEDVFAEAEHPEDGEEEDIIFIDNDTYVDDDEYEKSPLVWYILDDVLVDGEGEIIEDRFKLVGELLENVPEPTKSDFGVGALIFVRNRVLEVDYEIEVVDAEYEDMV